MNAYLNRTKVELWTFLISTADKEPKARGINYFRGL